MSAYSVEKKLRVALLLDSARLRGWQARVIDELYADGRFEVSLVIIDACKESGQARLLRRWKQIPWAITDRIENALSLRVFGRRSGQFTRYIALDDRPEKHAPRLEVKPLVSPSGFVQRFEEEDIEAIRRYAPDVMLRFGFRILRGGVLSVARHGIFSFHHGDNTWNRGGPPAFWEFYRRVPTTGAIVQILSEDLDNGDVLRRGHYRTFALSWNENRRRLYGASLWLMVDALRDLASTGKADITPPPAGLGIYDWRLLSAPDFMQCVVAVTRLGYRAVELLARAVIRDDRWHLRARVSDVHEAQLSRFHEIRPLDRRSFYADPFVVTSDESGDSADEKERSAHFFIEEFLYDKKRGVISHMEIPLKSLRAGETTRAAATIIMDEPHHLSYPFLFRYDNRLYMIPESSAAGSVDVWRCDDFPLGWTKEVSLLKDVDAADSSLVEHGGRWWLFTNVDRTGMGDHCSELSIYHADSPLSSHWQAHPMNPVVTDCRRARMGGGFVESHKGSCTNLVRVAQNSGETYGQGIVFCEILKLTTDSYEEQVIDSVLPNWSEKVRRTHHLAAQDGVVVIDACDRMTLR